jgi:hypothetical protein
MKYRILFFAVTFGVIFQLNAQSYFSKIKEFDQGTQGFSNITALDSNLFWIQTLKWLPGFSSQSGYYYMDGEGNFIDSFFYETKGLIVKALPGNNYFFKDDLIYQVYTYRETFRDHDIYVSSQSERDSVDFFPIDFDRPEWQRIFVSTMLLSGEHIYLFGVGYLPEDDPEHDLFMIKMDLEGNILWLRDIDHFPEPDDNDSYRSVHHIMSNVLETENHFYFTNWAGAGFFDASRVYKVTKEADLVWRSDLEIWVNSFDQCSPDITFTADSSAIIWMNNRITKLSDVGGDHNLLDSVSLNPISLTVLDTADGSFIEDYIHLKDNRANSFASSNVITSRFNGDYIFAGIWENLNGNLNHPKNPLVGRVSPSGEFKWVKRVADRWDSGFAARSFYSLIEADNQDLLLVGGTERLPGGGYLPAWVMRIGPDGCVPGHTYCNEDMLIISHPDIILSAASPAQRHKDLKVWPNPLPAGSRVHFSMDEVGAVSIGSASVRWYDTAAQQVAEEQLSATDRAGFLARVPPQLSPGLYVVEMRIADQRFVARVVVDR